MISNQAQEAFDHVFKHGLKDSLSPLDGDDCVITDLADLSEANESQVVILTISSFLLRLTVLIQFTLEATTNEHFARINNKSVAEMDVQAFHDVIAECGNLCCGIMNRDLLSNFPHMGLSTPSILDKKCAAHLGVLNYSYIKHVRVDINSTVRFYATLCVSEVADLDFSVDVDAEESTGELEMF